MTLKYACSFGLRSIVAGVEIQSVTGAPTIETTVVRTAGTALRIAPGGTISVQHAAYSSGQGVKYYRFYFYLHVDSSVNNLIFFYLANSSNKKIGLRVNTDSSLILYNEEDLAQIGSTSSALANDQWYRVELKVDDTTLSATTVEARVYSASDETALLWNPSGTINITATPDRFSFQNSNNASLDYVITDIVIIEGDATAPNSWAGRGSIGYLRPNEAGANAVWARGGTDSGANWSQTEETPPDDATTYVQSNTSGDIDDYNLDATPAGVASDDVINWVAPGARFAVSATTGGDPDFVMRVTAGGNTAESGNVSGAGATAYASYQTTPVLVVPMVLVDLPGASTAPWTKSDLDSAQIGIRESVTDTHFARVSAMWLMYEHKPAAPAPVGKIANINQAVKRAAVW